MGEYLEMRMEYFVGEPDLRGCHGGKMGYKTTGMKSMQRREPWCPCPAGVDQGLGVVYSLVGTKYDTVAQVIVMALSFALYSS